MRYAKLSNARNKNFQHIVIRINYSLEKKFVLKHQVKKNHQKIYRKRRRTSWSTQRRTRRRT